MPRNSNSGGHIQPHEWETYDAAPIHDASLEVQDEHMASARTMERKSKELQTTQNYQNRIREMYIGCQRRLYRILQPCYGLLKVSTWCKHVQHSEILEYGTKSDKASLPPETRYNRPRSTGQYKRKRCPTSIHKTAQCSR